MTEEKYRQENQIGKESLILELSDTGCKISMFYMFKNIKERVIIRVKEYESKKVYLKKI